MIEFLEEDDKKALLVYNSLDFFKFSFGDNIKTGLFDCFCKIVSFKIS